MKQRAINNGIYANYILIDSWYSKPIFIKEMNELEVMTISRIANNNSIWNFKDKEKTLNAIYEKYRHTANIVSSSYGKIKFKYFCVKVTHKTAGRLKVVFIKTNNKIIPIVSTNLSLQAKEIIDIETNAQLNLTLPSYFQTHF